MFIPTQERFGKEAGQYNEKYIFGMEFKDFGFKVLYGVREANYLLDLLVFFQIALEANTLNMKN